MLKKVEDGVLHVGIVFPKGMDEEHDGNGNELCGISARCRMCGSEVVLHVRVDDYEKWDSGARVQDAFPYIDPEYRELLISGTCPKCWDDMFKGFGTLEDEDKDEDEEAVDASH